MPRFYVEEIQVVGMYYYGNKQLPIDSKLKLIRDQHNLYDVNAVKVVRNGDSAQRPVAYVAQPG